MAKPSGKSGRLRGPFATLKALFKLRGRKAGRREPPMRWVIPPRELAGQWVAYSEDGTRIIAHGESLAKVHEEAMQADAGRPSFEHLDPMPRPRGGAEG